MRPGLPRDGVLRHRQLQFSRPRRPFPSLRTVNVIEGQGGICRQVHNKGPKARVLADAQLLHAPIFGDWSKQIVDALRVDFEIADLDLKVGLVGPVLKER